MDRRSLGVPLAVLRKEALRRLKGCPLTEAQAAIRRLLDHFWPGWPLAWLQSGGQAFFPSDKLPDWEQAIERLAEGQPLAYVTGEAFFGELRLRIQPGVFCPRPETEEWAHHLKNLLRPRPPTTLLDIGTGSGCLAVFLAQAFPNAEAYALDINPLAIQVTSQNATAHGVQLNLVIWDFFGETRLPPAWEPLVWELIISNPPYIPLSEKDEVDENVLNWEPKEALFCTDIEPYMHLATLATNRLHPIRGLLAAEVHPPTAERVLAHFKERGLCAQLYRDLSGRWRWLYAAKNPIILQSHV